jgi:hypothetical protein
MWRDCAPRLEARGLLVNGDLSPSHDLLTHLTFSYGSDWG